jgi:hypothetical protein
MERKEIPEVKTARNYSLIAIIWTALVSVLIMGIGALMPRLTFLLFLGIISLFIGLVAFITTTERLRSGDFEAAKMPCLAFGIVLLFFGAIFGGVLMLLAHSKISELRVRPSPEIPAAVAGGPPPTGLETSPAGTLVAEQLGELYCQSGPDIGKRFPITGFSIKIGHVRERTNNVQLTDDYVSRNHAQLTYDGTNFYIEDLGSKNGTYVDGQIVPKGSKMVVQDGSEIKLGPNTVLKLAARIEGGTKPA